MYTCCQSHHVLKQGQIVHGCEATDKKIEKKDNHITKQKNEQAQK